MTPKQQIDNAFDYADSKGFKVDFIKLNQEAYNGFIKEMANGLQEGTEIKVNAYRHALISQQSNSKSVEILMSYTPPVEVEEENETTTENTNENEND